MKSLLSFVVPYIPFHPISSDSLFLLPSLTPSFLLSFPLSLEHPSCSQAVVLCLPGLLSWSPGFLSAGTEQGLAGRYTEKSQLHRSHWASHTLTLLPVLGPSHTRPAQTGHGTRYDVCHDAAWKSHMDSVYCSFVAEKLDLVHVEKLEYLDFPSVIEESAGQNRIFQCNCSHNKKLLNKKVWIFHFTCYE